MEYLIRDAILDGYDHESLKRLIRFRFSSEFDTVDWDKDFNTVASSTVALFQRRGKLGDLAYSMVEDNPNNPKVQILGSGEFEFQGLDVDSRQYHGLSQQIREQIRELSEGMYKLRTAVFGDDELFNEGVIAELKAIKRTVDELQRNHAATREDVKIIKAQIVTGAPTLPDSGSAPKFAYYLSIAVSVLTSSLILLAGLHYYGIIGS